MQKKCQNLKKHARILACFLQTSKKTWSWKVQKMCHFDARSPPRKRYTDGQCHVDYFFIRLLGDVACDVDPPNSKVAASKSDVARLVSTLL